MTESDPDPTERVDLTDLAAIVTGGGSGIGRATARRLADAGADVLVVGRREEPLADLARSHPRIQPQPADVGEEADVDQVVKAALARWDRIDLVVNNAGAFIGGPLNSVTTGQVQHLFRVNVIGPTLLARAGLAHLTATRGAIVNVTSTYAQKAAPRAGHYAAAKAALESLTRSWALELAPVGVRVNAVSPGPTESGLLASSGVPAAMIEAIKAREVEAIPLGRRGLPDDVARWIVALCQPGWVTGQIIGVDGGLSVSETAGTSLTGSSRCRTASRSWTGSRTWRWAWTCRTGRGTRGASGSGCACATPPSAASRSTGRWRARTGSTPSARPRDG